MRELIRRLDHEWSFGQLNHEKLVDLFVHYDDKLYKDVLRTLITAAIMRMR